MEEGLDTPFGTRINALEGTNRVVRSMGRCITRDAGTVSTMLDVAFVLLIVSRG